MFKFEQPINRTHLEVLRISDKAQFSFDYLMNDHLFRILVVAHHTNFKVNGFAFCAKWHT